MDREPVSKEKRAERIVELFTDDGKDAERLKLWVIVGLISAHSNDSREKVEKNLALLIQFQDALADVPGVEKWREYCRKGIEILQGDLQRLEDERQT